MTTTTSPSSVSTRLGSKLAVAGAPFPVELAAAGDLHLVDAVLDLDDHDAAIEDAWIDEKEDPAVRSAFVNAMRGRFSDCAGIVAMRSMDHVYYYLREVLRQGEWEEPRPLHMCDIVPIQQAAISVYNRRAFVRLADFIGRVSGKPLTVERINDAIARENQLRAERRELAQARWAGKVAGSAAMRQLLGGGAAPRGQSDNPRLALVCSDPLNDVSMHHLLENGGWTVVCEDDGTSRFTVQDEVVGGDDPLGALADHYAALPGILAHPREARLGYIVEGAKAGHFDALLFCVTRKDMRLGWDIPTLRRQLADAGVPTCFFQGSIGDPSDAKDLSEASTALLAQVG